ncbi:MAG: ATP-dependent RNA helicase [Chthoniobacterales bacterium]|nr:ATP-dependent RNA helicase [Chthoniobacterales bacterium]
MTPRDLPIYELEGAIASSLGQQPRLILQAPTGSGKSTQVPQILLDHGSLDAGEVVILQPRRLAARLLAKRVAQERGGSLGQEVGYQIRFEKIASAKTRIRFVTEGILLRQLLQDPELRGVSAILFDEFHERHLYGDITLARALQLQETKRPDLLLMVMSATLESDKLEKYLAPCPVLTSSGRTHPVTIEYLTKPVRAENYPVWDLAADELERLAPRTEGDVLIFMPGKYEITRTLAAIRASRMSDRFVALPLYSELPPNEQDAALAPNEKRRVIVATNVAETSLTIDGVRLVIDAGLARIARFDPRRGINTLFIEKISRAAADQRAGRAGRTTPGHCLRLWTEREHIERAAQELPEVKRLDLAEVVLTLKASGIEDVAGFRWLEPPEPKALENAGRLLADLGALGSARASRAGDGASPSRTLQTFGASEQVRGGEAPPPAREARALPSGEVSRDDHTAGAITSLGQRMLAFPVHPRYARMLLAAQEEGCVRVIALIAALTQGRSLLRRAEGKQMREERDDFLGNEDESDLFILLRAFRFAEKNNFDPRRCASLGVNAGAAREAAQLWEQFLAIARAEGLDVAEREAKPDAIARCVLTGFPDQVAARLDEGTLRCALVHQRRGVLARASVVHRARLLVASEIREIEASDGERQVLLTLATAINAEWLGEFFPDAIRGKVEVFFDPTLRRVLGRKATLFHDLVLEEKKTERVPPNDAASLLAREVIAGTCPLKKWDHAIEQWIARLNFAAARFPDLELPPIGESERALLIEQICLGATSYKEVKERPVAPVLKSWLSAAQQNALEQFAPERIKLPNERNARITYAPSAPPTIATRIQDLYGVENGLTIGPGRVPLRIEVLAPNHRPIQITDDLATFWRESYPKIKKELQRKYPKHRWL